MKITVDNCTFHKRVLMSTTEYTGGVFPAFIDVYSPKTNRTVKFVKDEVRAQQCEWWDGELYEYIPTEATPNCKCLVIVRKPH